MMISPLPNETDEEFSLRYDAAKAEIEAEANAEHEAKKRIDPSYTYDPVEVG